MELPSISFENLIPSSSQNSAKMENFAKHALSAGLDNFTSKQYDQAIISFKRVVGMAPRTETAINAYDYMARAYLSKGDSQSAIDAYNKALKIDPKRDDLHLQLGKIYTTNGRFDEARAEYELAVKANPIPANRYALGQGYLGTGQYDEAIQQFERVRQREPNKPYGNQGLGQVYAKQGLYEKAIEAFKSAIVIKSDYKEAYSEMGYAYADNGNLEQAEDIVTTLNALSPNDTSLANTLSQYISEKTKPKMTSLYVSDLYAPFLSTLGPGTSINALSSYLANAGDERTFAMVFQFNKPMSQTSVENIFNWNIARAIGSGRADGYNYDIKLPTTEVALPPTPLAVYYNKDEQTATVLFNIRQNATANGTIDPSHINFSFNGKDAVGLSIDKSADQYSGFSGFA